MKLVKIYLKGGQTIEVNCQDVEIYVDQIGNIRTVSWYNPDVQTQYLRASDISAIVEV